MSPYHQPSVAPPRPATSLPCARVTSENEVKLRAQLWEWGLSTPTSRTLIRCAALSPASIAKMASLTATWILMLCLAPSTGKSPSHDDNDVSARQSVNDVTKLDAAFTKYVYDQQLYGAALGVLHKGKLIYGDGRGFVRGDDAAAGTLMPVLGLSKLLTALAVLRLADHGKLRLDDKLFGHGGLLQRHRPRDGDQRLGHITVEHLLRHQGGWDETIEPLYDPMLNELYVHRQYNVTDIARELGRGDVRLEQADIMQYVLGRPLAFAPGSRTVHSNFGYSLLGRVIKAASGASYHAYVRRHVLVPVGMWHTRIGPDPHEDGEMRVKSMQLEMAASEAAGHLKSGGQSEASTTGKPRYIYDLLRPGVIDSTLGWHSNVYDLARLVANVFESGDADTAILRPESVKRMLARPALPTPQHSERWQGMGDLRVQNDGTFWYESHDPILHTTIFLYHKQGVRATTNSQQLRRTVPHRRDVTIFLLGMTHKQRSHLTGSLRHKITESLDLDVYGDDALLGDLGGSHLTVNGRDLIVKYRVEEHRFAALANAMRLEGFYPDWIHGYSDGHHSYYAMIFARAAHANQLKFVVHTSASKKRTISFISAEVSRGFQTSFLQSFVSAAHHGQVCHLVVMKRTPSVRKMEFNVGVTLDEYIANSQEATLGGFLPLVQSVDTHRGALYISYLFEQTRAHNRNTQSYHDLTLARLESNVHSNALAGFGLDYLDTYAGPDGKPRFSAVFGSERVYNRWLLQTEVALADVPGQVHTWAQRGYSPQLLVAYHNDGQLRFAGLWVTPLSV